MQKRQLNNLIKRVFNKPQFITLEDLQPITDYLQDPVRAAQIKIESAEAVEIKREMYDSQEAYDKARKESIGIDTTTGIGYLNIEGTLVNRAGTIRACTELTSYEGLKKTFEAQVAEGITTCVLMVDSGGGEAYRAFASANAVRKLATENGVKLIAYVDGTSASAAYAWSVIADEIIANPMARIGSVGVVVQLYNDTGYLEKMGVKRSFIYAGGNKVPFDADGEFTESFLAALQESVDKSYNSFVDHVASNRKMDRQQVIDTQASVYDADKALSVGFIDRIMEVEDFDLYLASLSTSNNKSSTSPMRFESLVHENEEIMTNIVEQTVDQASEASEDLVQLKAQLDLVTGEKSQLATEVAELQKQLADQVVKTEALQASFNKFKEATALEARKTQLAAVFGTESTKVEEYATMFASVNDQAFAILVADLKTTQAKSREEMREIGHSANEKPVAEDASTQLEERAKQRKQA